MFRAEFGAVDSHHGVFVVEHGFGQGLCERSLSGTRRTGQQRREDRSVLIVQSGSRQSNGIRDGLDGGRLSDDRLCQRLFEFEQFGLF